jgi:enolase-phosphatase E1
MLTAIVLDIEGTTSSTGFVHDTLYPYSRQRFASWIAGHVDDPVRGADVHRQLAAVRTLAGEPDADVERCVWWLHHWLDNDQKVTPLKAFQGWIWSEGFACGDLTSHFYTDAIPAMRRWHAAGHRLYVFSSGSLAAQHAWFGHTPEGDLAALFSGHWDTETAGPKKEPGSYRTISADIAATCGVDASQTVFLSDLVDELDAARAAGWQTVGVRRVGDQYFDQGVGDHLAITSFDQVDLSGDRPLLVGEAAH